METKRLVIVGSSIQSFKVCALGAGSVFFSGVFLSPRTNIYGPQTEVAVTGKKIMQKKAFSNKDDSNLQSYEQILLQNSSSNQKKTPGKACFKLLSGVDLIRLYVAGRLLIKQ